VLDISVTIIFGDKTIEFTPIQECGQLREDILEIIHKQVISRKGTKSRPFALKNSATNYISIISKNAWRFLVDSNDFKLKRYIMYIH
jgi:hypothetical protein